MRGKIHFSMKNKNKGGIGQREKDPEKPGLKYYIDLKIGRLPVESARAKVEARSCCLTVSFHGN